jgi:hypothetical protein
LLQAVRDESCKSEYEVAAFAKHDEGEEGATLTPRTTIWGKNRMKRGDRIIGYLHEALRYLPTAGNGSL